MRVLTSARLFPWEALEDCPSLRTLREMMQALPDARLLAALARRRDRGRNEYPVHVLWGVMLLSIVCRHPTIQSCLDELHRNPDLRRLIGIEREGQIPKKWTMSRFQQVLGLPEIYPLLREIFDVLIARLGAAVPGLGRHLAGDSCHLSARYERAEGAPAAASSSPMFAPAGKARADKGRGADRAARGGREASRLPQPAGGRKEYRDDEGRVAKVVEWFGYKLHLLVDRDAEVVLGWKVTSANAADSHQIADLLDQARRNLPEGRTQTLACDKAADDSAVHHLLDQTRIQPLIQITRHWKDDTERMLPGHDGRSNVVHDEAGTLYCYDKSSDPPVRRKMYYAGHEAQRGTLKYRCPAAAQGFSCPSESVCNAGRPYGKTVRVDREIDLRRFPPIPRATRKFETLYNGRTAVERVNARLKIFWGADDGNVTGAERFHGQAATVMIVHAAMATLLAAAPRRGATLGQTRLLPIAQALREHWRAGTTPAAPALAPTKN